MISGNLENIIFNGISIDTRTIKPGNLFFAMMGENLDGHDFIEEAKKKGASGAVVCKNVKVDIPQVLVTDTIKKLGEIAHAWREKFSLPLIALTGSNGKTTTKNMIGAILKESQKPILVTQGNLNNHLGVPLMLSELNDEHAYAVIEMGMNHFHEISYLTHLAHPTTTLITNAGPCHLEGLDGTLQGVAKAKGEIFEGLAEEGVAIINVDDEFADYWKTLCRNQKILTFGINHPADVRGQLKGKGFEVAYRNQKIFIQLNLLGRHNIMNALAASAATIANGFNLFQIKEALEKIWPAPGRMEMKSGKNGVTVIDDTYNANPFSLRAAIESISHNLDQKKILVLGDMKELGEQSVTFHRECGKFAKENGIDMLFATGELTAHTVKNFGENAKHFLDQLSLIKELEPYLNQDNLILVKGSRSMKMEKVVQAIL